MKKFSGLLVFLIVCLLGNMFLFNIAKQWPKMIKKWREIEDIFLNHQYIQSKKIKLLTKVRAMAFTLIIVAIGKYFSLIITLADAFLK